MPRFALPTQRALLLAGPLRLGGCAPTLPERPPAPVTTAAPIAPPPSAPRDRDRDGVVDDRDACPDLEGVAPDGCPDPDRDGDSFPDRRDRCPDQTGVEPDGCPIPDSDGDAILDPDDHCPREPETRNGYADHDGCPDPIPAELATITGVLRGVHFELDRDVIRPASRPTLERVVRALEYFPTVRIEVSAHLDSTGSTEYCKDLSGRRAAAVKRYLADRGIDPKRIESRGAGPDEPVDTNKTARGRARNRRIELTLLVE
jgi:OOP family OmpA-OmpF porin